MFEILGNFRDREYFTVTDAAREFNTTRPKAGRAISTLTDLGLLVVVKTGKTYRYTVRDTSTVRNLLEAIDAPTDEAPQIDAYGPVRINEAPDGEDFRSARVVDFSNMHPRR